jgi:hypothetical protein
MAFPKEFAYLPALVLAFLVIDLLLDVGSLLALLSNYFFWLYWLVYSVAAETALYFLQTLTHPDIASSPKPLQLLIAVLGTATVLQSLTFKVGGKRVLDLSRYLDDYRGKVLSSSASLVTRFERRKVLKQCQLILKKAKYVEGDPESEARMKAIYAQVMLFGARKSETVQKEIATIQQDCTLTGASFGNEVARRVAQTDPEWVRNFLAN